jgi:broad specificity phosphatase PhoE
MNHLMNDGFNFFLVRMDIYFLRHGESLFNLDNKNDFIDCSLTFNGISQSKQIDFNQYPKHYSLIICSPLSRCIQTFQHSNITYDQFEINDLFREIRSGCQSDLLNENENILIETDEQIQQRINQIHFYLSEKKQLNIQNILILTHADLIWNLTSKNINGELFGIWLNNAQLIHWKQI